MKTKQAVPAEVVTPDLVVAEAARGTRPQDFDEFLEKLVMQRLAEIFAKREDFILEPWFRTRRVAQEIRKLQTVQQRDAKAVHFDRHGCISCHTKNRPHYASGICTRCYPTLLAQMHAIERELTAQHEKQPYVPRDLGKLAEECLNPSVRPLPALKGKE